MCQNQGFRTASDSLNLFPFSLCHVGIEIALKREAGGSMRVMNNKKVILPISPNISLNNWNPVQINIISYR
jgi:hypothetical protein